MPIPELRVPHLGQSFKVLAAYSTAVIECQCEAKTVIVLHGAGRVQRCKACNTPFGIAKSGTLSIGEAVSADASALVQV